MPSTTRRAATICPRCGRALEEATVTLGGRTYVVGTRPCECPGAAGDRARADAERDRIAAERAGLVARERELRRRSAYESAGIAARYVDADDTPEAAAILDGVRRGRGAYVSGPVGVGKTHLALTAARMAMDAGMRVRVTSAPAILAALKATFGERDRTEDDVMADLAGADLLVIDDLGKESPTDWCLMQLFRLVDARYSSLRPIVVTSQYARSDLIRRLSGRDGSETAVAIVSRLAEMCERVALDGADRRLAHV